jgi:biopolymer transport protein ExbD
MILGRSRSPREASFDLTPMIDVVLLLIIFFMLSSQFAQTEMRPVDLPREPGDKAAQDETKATLVIDVDRAGALSILGKAIEPKELRDAVDPSRRTGGTATTQLILRVDRNCESAHLNRLARMLASWGVREWRLATAPPGAPIGERASADGGGT